MDWVYESIVAAIPNPLDAHSVTNKRGESRTPNARKGWKDREDNGDVFWIS